MQRGSERGVGQGGREGDALFHNYPAQPRGGSEGQTSVIHLPEFPVWNPTLWCSHPPPPTRSRLFSLSLHPPPALAFSLSASSLPHPRLFSLTPLSTRPCLFSIPRTPSSSTRSHLFLSPSRSLSLSVSFSSGPVSLSPSALLLSLPLPLFQPSPSLLFAF